MTWSSVTIVPSWFHTTPLPSPLSVRIVTTEGDSFRTIAGIPGCAAGTCAPLDPVVDVDVAAAPLDVLSWPPLEQPATTSASAARTTAERRAVRITPVVCPARAPTTRAPSRVPEHVLPRQLARRIRLLRETEHALAKDVAHDLGRPALDRV